MTRQVYYYKPDTDTYYVSGELEGDIEWDALLELLNYVTTLTDFLMVLSQITQFYNVNFGRNERATRLRRLNSDTMEIKDETYGIVDGDGGVFLDKNFSKCI